MSSLPSFLYSSISTKPIGLLETLIIPSSISFFFFSVVSARGAVRLIMILALPASIMASYLIVETTSKALSSNKKSNTIAITISFLIVISAIYSGYVCYNEGYNSAKVQAPYVYTFQWQKAMDWVRNRKGKKIEYIGFSLTDAHNEQDKTTPSQAMIGRSDIQRVFVESDLKPFIKIFTIKGRSSLNI